MAQNRMTIAMVNEKVQNLDSRMSMIEESTAKMLKILEGLSVKAQTPAPAPVVEEFEVEEPTGKKVREFEGKDGSKMYQKGKLTVYSTQYRNQTVWTVAAAKVPYTDKVTGEKKSFAPKENRAALAQFCKGKKLVDFSFTDEKGRKVVYQRPIYRTAQEVLAAIQ